MEFIPLNVGSRVASLKDAALRLKKGGEVCVVEFSGELKAYSLSRAGYFMETVGKDKVHIVKGEA